MNASTVTVLIQSVLDAEPNRPPGYVAECMSKAIKKTETTLIFDADTYAALSSKYGGGGRCQGCGA